jgi:hypothetical protein
MAQSQSLLTTKAIISLGVTANAQLGVELVELLNQGYALPEVSHLTSRILSINDSLNYIVMSNPSLADRQLALDHLLSRLPRPLQPRQVINTLYEILACDCEPTPSLPRAAPPTEGIVDDVNDTFSFTLGANSPLLSDYEVSINGLSYTSLPAGSYISGIQLVIPNLAYSIPTGNLLVRVKASSTYLSSVTLSNLDPFTVTPKTPPAPTYVSASDVLNTLTFAPPMGYLATDCDYRIRGGSPINCTGPTINLGNIILGYQELEIYVRENLPKNYIGASLFNEVTFSEDVILPTPDSPGVTGDDTLNTLVFTGSNEIVVSINGGPFIDYAGPYSIGDIDLPAGYYKAKVKATSLHKESGLTDSPAFTKTPEALAVAFFGTTLNAVPTEQDVLSSTRQDWNKAGRKLDILCPDAVPFFAEEMINGIRNVTDGNGFDINNDLTRILMTLTIGGVQKSFRVYYHQYAQGGVFTMNLSAV